MLSPCFMPVEHAIRVLFSALAENTSQRGGIAKAQREGRYKGRAPTARAKSDEVLRLLKSGVRATDVAKQVGIARRSVYRIVAAAKP